MHHPNGGAISGAGGVGWQKSQWVRVGLGGVVRHDGQTAVTSTAMGVLSIVLWQSAVTTATGSCCFSLKGAAKPPKPIKTH